LDCIDTLSLFIATEGKKNKKNFTKVFLVQKHENSSYYPYLSALPKTFEIMLENWPKKFDEFLPNHTKQGAHIFLRQKFFTAKF